MEFSLLNHPFWGTPRLWNPPYPPTSPHIHVYSKAPCGHNVPPTMQVLEHKPAFVAISVATIVATWSKQHSFSAKNQACTAACPLDQTGFPLASTDEWCLPTGSWRLKVMPENGQTSKKLFNMTPAQNMSKLTPSTTSRVSCLSYIYFALPPMLSKKNIQNHSHYLDNIHVAFCIAKDNHQHVHKSR